MFESVINRINDIVWSPALVVLLVAAGLYFSIRTRFVQLRRIGLMVRLLFTRPSGKMSSFKTFCLALSGRVGTGNVVGVATAIALGGPGAIFWMWVIALLGASTAFMESTLARMYRFPHKDGWRGGPASYIEKGLGLKWLGTIFAIVTILGYGLLIVAVQANGVSSAFSNSFSVHPAVTGVITVALLFAVTIGGMKRIANFASVVTPFMSVAYVLMALIIIIANIDQVPGAFSAIFKSALGFDQALGGMLGSAIAMGVKRGLFSNEAGQGGGAIVSAMAETDHPAKQGLVQSFSVYIDTLLVCTSTALMILCTGLYNIFDQKTGEAIVLNAPELGNNYVAYTQAAIDTVFHGFGSAFVSVALAFFVFTSILAYVVYADSSITYLCRTAGHSEKTRNICNYLYMAGAFGMIMFGSLSTSTTAWTLGDIGLGLTTWINVIALLILCPKALESLKNLENSI